MSVAKGQKVYLASKTPGQGCIMVPGLQGAGFLGLLLLWLGCYGARFPSVGRHQPLWLEPRAGARSSCTLDCSIIYYTGLDGAAMKYTTLHCIVLH